MKGFSGVGAWQRGVSGTLDSVFTQISMATDGLYFCILYDLKQCKTTFCKVVKPSCVWINIIRQWRAVWNTQLQERCKGRKLSSLYLQLFIIQKNPKTQHLAYSVVVQAELPSGSRRLSNLRFSTDAALIQTFQELQLLCPAWDGCGKPIPNMPFHSRDWTADASTNRRWVKVLPCSCKTTKFNWKPKMCSNRIVCVQDVLLETFFFDSFERRDGTGLKSTQDPGGAAQVCLSHSSLLQAHSSKGNTHIHDWTVHPPCATTQQYK